jgi:DNA repair protein RadD
MDTRTADLRSADRRAPAVASRRQSGDPGADWQATRGGADALARSARSLPVAVRRWLEFFAGKECQACGRAIDGIQLRRHWDHICARRVGGENVAFNLQQLCHQCNLRKWAHLTPQVRAMLLAEERRGLEISDYFHAGTACILGNPALREPQRLAYLAIREHFVRRRKTLPAIIQVPTGCGKSGIMCIAPYGVANGRVLVVAPNLTIKNGLERALAGSFFLQRGIFERATQLARVVTLGPHANREDCLRAEFVLANVQQIQSWLPLFPSTFFDMVLVDEGHHTPAESWQRINETFPHAKKVYLTATPFRGDGRGLYGERIYSYSLSEAMSQNFVKRIVKVDAVPARLTFTAEGEDTEYTTEEILAMREETWFSKGVALSEACNRSIVEKSIQILADKRRGGRPHQLIAAACSIHHARQVVALYRACGARATIVHSKMEMAQRQERMERFERGDFDVIVHVGLLGEGYDHPPLSVAAVFRPFRTLSPYAQFIGRTLRRLPGGSPEDNVAHVVSHMGLNLDSLWGYFKQETHEAGLLEALEASEVLEKPEKEREEDAERDLLALPEVVREEIARYAIDTFLPIAPEERARYEADLAQLAAPDEGRPERAVRLPDLRAIMRALKWQESVAREALEDPVVVSTNRPDVERHEFRQLLATRVRKAAGRVMAELGLGSGTELVPLVGKGEEKTNYQVVIRLVNRHLNSAMGKPPTGSDRLRWTLEECRQALAHVDPAAGATEQDLRTALASARPAKEESI